MTTTELFLTTPFAPPRNTAISSFVNYVIFILADPFMSFIPDPGFMKPNTTYSLFNCCFTSDAHPLVWLSPKINTLCALLFTPFFL